jgi:lipoprotein signal peptidase
MARSAVVLVAAAAVATVADLAHKAVVLAESGAAVPAHPRSGLYVVGVAFVSGLWAGAIVLTRSAALAVGGGILVGGAAGNLVSLALWPSVDGVPNPLVAGDVAFNLADVTVVLGLALVLVSAIAFAARNRGRLSEAVRY